APGAPVTLDHVAGAATPAWPACGLVERDVALLDDVFRPVVLLFDFLGELFRRVARRRRTLLVERLDDLRVFQGHHGGVAQLVDDVHGRARGRQQSVPDRLVQLREIYFLEGGHVFDGVEALGLGNGHCAQVARLDLVHGRRQVVEQDLDLAADRVRHGRTRPLVGHVHDVGAGGDLERFTHQVQHAARARAAVRVLAGGASSALRESTWSPWRGAWDSGTPRWRCWRNW